MKKLLEFKNITKTFLNGKIIANSNVSFPVLDNEVHAIIGENGAGKSTLMSILFGLYKQDSGDILINDKVVDIKTPSTANKMGIGMVHQHFKLVESLTCLENSILGQERVVDEGYEGKDKIFIDYKYFSEKFKQICKKYNFDLKPDTIVRDLTVGQKQKLEIIKMLWQDKNIIIFDEPTAVLSPTEIEGFLNLVRDFQKQGKTIIIITHKLDEVKSVADNFTVLRRGKVTGSGVVKNTSIDQMANMMVGKPVTLNIKNPETTPGKKVLELINISYEDSLGVKKLDKVSFEVHENEIVGIAGVEGNGQSELIKSIIGLIKPSEGDIKLTGTESTRSLKQKIRKQNSIEKVNKLIDKETDETKLQELYKLRDDEIQAYDTWELQYNEDSKYITNESINHKLERGVAYIPEDRHAHGLVLDNTCKENVVLQNISSFTKWGFLQKKKISDYAKSIIKRFDVRGADEGNAIARGLSGGNQQKLIIGREVERSHKLLLACQPTRGLDVGAIENIYEIIVDDKTSGAAVLLVSYELHELVSVCDRIIVMSKGKVVGNLTKKEITFQKLGSLMGGAH